MPDSDHDKTPRLPVWEIVRREEEQLRSLLRVDVGAQSHPGKVRKNNEDHHLALRVHRSLETIATNLPDGDLPRRLDQQGYVLLVADGIGGRSGGEHASRRAISALVEIATRIPDWILQLDDTHASELMQRAGSYFEQVDAILEAEAAADPALAGMGTTMTAVYLLDRDLIVAHVGDSRAYRFRDGELLPVTHDQTLAQALADAGVIAAEEVKSHRQRHILTGALGATSGAPRVQLGRHDLRNGDRVLLASDGLTEMLSDTAIADILRAESDPAAACAALVAAALDEGGSDNVTVMVADCRLPVVNEAAVSR
ncbi:MAG: protein phosphatase 2C domain-containing protein [Thermoanaerobaculia bacterium]